MFVMVAIWLFTDEFVVLPTAWPRASAASIHVYHHSARGEARDPHQADIRVFRLIPWYDDTLFFLFVFPWKFADALGVLNKVFYYIFYVNVVVLPKK